MAQGWIGVDLDGTLAHYEPGMSSIFQIGDPIPEMLARVKTWVYEEGKLVKIFTARVGPQESSEVNYGQIGDFIRQQVELIHEWCDKHGLPRLEVTCKKDFAMVELWDDRCVQVQMNTGKPVAIMLAKIIRDHCEGIEWVK